MSLQKPWNGLPTLPGPSALKEATILRQLWFCQDPVERDALRHALRELYASASKDPVPEEDLEWALDFRARRKKFLDKHRRNFAGMWAYGGYLRSSGGTFDGRPALPWEVLDKDDEEPWCDFGERVRTAPAGEGEQETVEAALAAYAESRGQPAPPCSEHWLAALRTVRAKFAPQNG